MREQLREHNERLEQQTAIKDMHAQATQRATFQQTYDKQMTALDGKLAIASGLVRTAYLVGVRYQQGQSGHLLAFVDARPGTETALVQAVNEALTFSGIEAGSIDVGFFDKANPLLQSLSDCGLRFDLPDPLQAVTLEAPRMKAEKPPILR